MTTGSENLSDPRNAIVARGRMALEALKSREQAALYHAAHADLQVALLEAECGNDQFLERWLKQYRSLMDQEPDLRQHLASVQSSLDFTDVGVDAIDEKFVEEGDAETTEHRILSTVAEQSPVTDQPKIDESPSAPGYFSTKSFNGGHSPWPAMIVGAELRAKRRAGNRPLCPAVGKPSDFETATADLLIPDQTSDLFGSARSDNPISIPTALQDTLKHDNVVRSKKKYTWLSWAVIGSTAAHLLALIAMSVYVIQLSRNPEPKAIIASAVETETLSMEAPMELSMADAPTVDPSDAPMPTLPSFAAASAATSSLQLPTSMTGLITGDTPSAKNGAIQQATNSTMANAVANSVQFFGVKAAGNTFCYVVDGSPSMKKDGAFLAAKADLVRSLSLLKPKQRFYITFFGGEIERLKLGKSDEELYPVYATPENIKKTISWIDRVRVQERGLAPNNALSEAIKMDPDGIFLLFDGDTKVDVAAHLRKANRSDDLISGGTPSVPIHTIGFYTQEFEPLMKRIATENNGIYRFVPKPMMK